LTVNTETQRLYVGAMNFLYSLSPDLAMVQQVRSSSPGLVFCQSLRLSYTCLFLLCVRSIRNVKSFWMKLKTHDYGNQFVI
jgi:hypothetical protein